MKLSTTEGTTQSQKLYLRNNSGRLHTPEHEYHVNNLLFTLKLLLLHHSECLLATQVHLVSTLHLRCSMMDLGHFTVVLANFIATFRLYSDNLLQATEGVA